METDDYLPIYALAEWHYCPRSAFLSWFGAEREDRVTPAYQKMREAHTASDEPSRRDRYNSPCPARRIAPGFTFVTKPLFVAWISDCRPTERPATALTYPGS